MHEVTIYAEPILNAGFITITNSLLLSFVSLILVFALVRLIKVEESKAPKGLQNAFEYIFEGALDLADSVTGSREKSVLFLPFVLPLFFFILINNWLGLLPGVGSIGFIEYGKFVPILRGSTADLNTTLALSLASLFITHLAGIAIAGWRSHVNRFVAFDSLLALPKEIKKEGTKALIINPIKFFVGLMEIIGEFSKTASLSLRLFGNILAGEILIGTMMSIFAFLLPVPFLFLEIFVGLIQAAIFAILSLVFLSIMSERHEEAH